MPNQHFSQPICQKLEALGVECVSGMWWYDKKWNPFNYSFSVGNEIALTEFEFLMAGNDEYKQMVPKTPAYDFQSIMTRDALIKVFGEKRELSEWVDGVFRKCNHCSKLIELSNPSGYCNHIHYPDSCEICLAKTKDWQYYRNLLAEAYSEEGIEGCEKVLEGVL